MTENCENACFSLVRLEQQVDDLRRQNGADHKDFRIQIADAPASAGQQTDNPPTGELTFEEAPPLSEGA